MTTGRIDFERHERDTCTGEGPAFQPDSLRIATSRLDATRSR
jgi:hypothetical protein